MIFADTLWSYSVNLSYGRVKNKSTDKERSKMEEREREERMVC